jgi:hypothetical protein
MTDNGGIRLNGPRTLHYVRYNLVQWRAMLLRMVGILRIKRPFKVCKLKILKILTGNNSLPVLQNNSNA